MKFKFDWFMKGMVIAVLIAFLWPEPGARGGWLHPELLNKLGIAIVFYLNGLALSIAAMHDGLKRWRAHLLIQGATFLIFPLLGLALIWLCGGFVPGDLQTGFFYLCALPSTVSSSVALTVAARGNVPVAVFNATLSSLIGVILTPMWVALILGHSGQSFEVWPVIVDLLEWLVLPLVAGLCSRPLLAAWASRHKKRLQIVDRLTILMLVYTSFADSVKEGIWSNYGPLVLVETVLGSALFFALVFWIIRLIAKTLKMPIEEEIAVVFCGSKKTLASGVPMAHLIFGSNPALGLILMPIMIYHPLQLAIGGVLAQRWAERGKTQG
jgi:sodium/bile acid cotransporter 7